MRFLPNFLSFIHLVKTRKSLCIQFQARHWCSQNCALFNKGKACDFENFKLAKTAPFGLCAVLTAIKKAVSSDFRPLLFLVKKTLPRPLMNNLNMNKNDLAKFFVLSKILKDFACNVVHIVIAFVNTKWVLSTTLLTQCLSTQQLLTASCFLGKSGTLLKKKGVAVRSV